MPGHQCILPTISSLYVGVRASPAALIHSSDMSIGLPGSSTNKAYLCRQIFFCCHPCLWKALPTALRHQNISFDHFRQKLTRSPAVAEVADRTALEIMGVVRRLMLGVFLEAHFLFTCSALTTRIV